MSVVTSHLFRGLHRHLQEHGYDASSAAFREVSLEAEETHNSSVIVGECAAQASHRVFATQHANKTWQMRARRGDVLSNRGTRQPLHRGVTSRHLSLKADLGVRDMHNIT